MIVTIAESRQLRPSELDSDLATLVPDNHLLLLIARQRFAGLLEINALASQKGLPVVAGVSFSVDPVGDGRTQISLIALASSPEEMRKLLDIRVASATSALTTSNIFDTLSSVESLTLLSGSPLFRDTRVINCVSPSRIPIHQMDSERVLPLRTLGVHSGDGAGDAPLGDLERTILDNNISWLDTFRHTPDSSIFAQIQSHAWGVLAHSKNASHRLRLHDAIQHELAILEHRPDIQGVIYDAWKLTTLAHEHGIALGPGRGSSAASALIYALGISDIDPIEHNLYPYRFFSESHTPDIDIDIDARNRGLLISLASQRFGLGKLSLVASQNDGSALRRHPSAIVLDGGVLPRLSSDPLQVDCTSADCEVVGIPVTDLLSSHMVSTLTAMQQTSPEITSAVPSTTPWDLLSRCLTLGIPHLNTPLAHSVLRQVKPTTIEELEDVLALMRPGASRSLQQYLSYRKGASERPLLYQEDVYEICACCPTEVQHMAIQLVANKTTFQEAGVASFDELLCPHGVSTADARRIQAMGGYAFSRPHATAYAEMIMRFLDLKASNPIQWIKTLPAISNADPSAVWQEMAGQLHVQLVIPEPSLAPLHAEVTPESLIIGLDVMLGDELKAVEFMANREWLPIASTVDASRRIRALAI